MCEIAITCNVNIFLKVLIPSGWLKYLFCQENLEGINPDWTNMELELCKEKIEGINPSPSSEFS